MITCSAWKGKRYAVLGLARSGAATVRALVASGASVVAWDSDAEKRTPFLLAGGERKYEAQPSSSPARGRWRAEAVTEGEDSLTSAVDSSPSTTDLRSAVPLLLAGEELAIAPLNTLDLATVDALVLSPGVPLNTHPLAARARAQGVPIIGDIELFAQARGGLSPHKVVGITGTNGKSTTTALVHQILRMAGVPSLMGGNIGLPILGVEPLPEGGVYVLELSSYQIDLTQTLDCDVAVLLNITPDHLDRYDGFEAYAASKARLFKMQGTGQAVVAVDEPLSRQLAEDYNAVRVTENDYPKWQRQWPALQGPHNRQNAAAAIAVAKELGIGWPTIEVALASFPGLPHRMQRVGEVAGVAYVNDSKATNPDSAAPALAAFARVHWILGGRAKGDDLDACRPHFSHVARAYTIGEAGPVFARLLRRDSVPVEEAETLARAVTSAAARAQPGDTVLLSPAAASFDQFTDFEARGDVFRALVEALQ